VKIAPSNQTLLLASDRFATGAAVLKRITIVAAQPESFLYLRADYSPAADAFATATDAPSDAPSSGTDLVPLSASMQLRLPSIAATGKDLYGNPRVQSRDGGLSSYLRPAEQYALTQRITDTPALAQIDVHV
jgi:hypothetical protein